MPTDNPAPTRLSPARRLVRGALWILLVLAVALPLVWTLALSPATRFGLRLWLTADGSWADLRNDAVIARSPASEARGRELLTAAARRHGLDAWRSHRTASVTATDLWSESNHPWWPAPRQRFRREGLIDTFTSRAILLDGPSAGEVRGLQSWRAYRQAPGDGAPVALDGPDLAIEFYLPTLQYFDELPLRLLSAELFADAGEEEFRGKSYDRVFVTWGHWEPHAEHDQYVVWIARDSGLIEMVHYTLRDAVRMVGEEQRDLMRKGSIGTIHFRDFRAVSGVVFPFRHYVTLFGPRQAGRDLEESSLHRLRVESLAFDQVAPAALTPLPGLPRPDGGKPAG